MKIHSTLTVLKIEQRERVVRGFKDAKGDGVLMKESTGWWIVFADNFSIHVGDEKPDVKEGEELIITIEAVRAV